MVFNDAALAMSANEGTSSGTASIARPQCTEDLVEPLQHAREALCRVWRPASTCGDSPLVGEAIAGTEQAQQGRVR